MKVVQLGKHRAKDVGAALRFLLEKWERGEVKGIALCFKDHRNVEFISFTGEYRDDPAHALSAAMKMSRRINDVEDDQDGTLP